MNAPFSSSRQSQVIYCSLVTAYMEDIGHRLKPTTIENMRNIIDTKLLPYFSKRKVREIGTITVRKWQNELISYHDEDGEPYSDTYLKSVHNQLSAILNYAVKHYGLTINPCKVAGSIGKSKADEMKIWTQDQFEQFSRAIVKSAMKLAFDVLFFTGMRSGELLALTPADRLPTKRIRINKTYTKMAGENFSSHQILPKEIELCPYPTSCMMKYWNMSRAFTASRRQTESSILPALLSIRKSRERQRRQDWSQSEFTFCGTVTQVCLSIWDLILWKSHED